MTEQLARKAQQAYKELQVMWVPQVQSALQEALVQQALWELPAHKVLPEMTGQLVHKGQQAYKELRVL